MIRVPENLSKATEPRLRSDVGFIKNLAYRFANYLFRDRRALRDVWGFPTAAARIIISKLPSEEYSNMAGVGEALSLSLLLPILDLVYAKSYAVIPSVGSATPDLPDYQECNLILLGNPLTNQVTKMVLEMYRSSGILTSDFGFVNDELFVPQIGGMRYKPVIATDPKYVEIDYGLILKAPSPFRPDRTVMVLSGCRTFGTHAATACVVASEYTRRISKAFGKGSFIGVAEARMSSSNPLADEISIVSMTGLPT